MLTPIQLPVQAMSRQLGLMAHMEGRTMARVCAGWVGPAHLQACSNGLASEAVPAAGANTLETIRPSTTPFSLLTTFSQPHQGQDQQLHNPPLRQHSSCSCPTAFCQCSAPLRRRQALSHLASLSGPSHHGMALHACSSPSSHVPMSAQAMLVRQAQFTSHNAQINSWHSGLRYAHTLPLEYAGSSHFAHAADPAHTPAAGAPASSLLFTTLAGLASYVPLMFSRRLKREPEPFEAELDEEEYEYGEFEDLGPVGQLQDELEFEDYVFPVGEDLDQDQLDEGEQPEQLTPPSQ